MPLTEKQKNAQYLDTLAHIEKLKLLYHQSFPAIVVSIVTSSLLVIMLWSVQSHDILLNWFIILTSTTLVRSYVFMRYQKISPQGADVLTWEKPYFITLFVSSLVWGVGSVIIMPLDSPVHQAAIYYSLIGMAGGAISVYSAHRLMTLVTVACVLLPATGWFFTHDSIVSTVMAIGAVIFFASAIRATNVLSSALHQNFLLTHQLKHSRDLAEKLARKDELTGLDNRRAFYEHAEALINYCQRNKEELTLILMDIDYFKNINDTHGHAGGDVALKQISKILQQRIRTSDICARIGGEEFVVLLPASALNATAQLAEELRQTIAETALSFNDSNFFITASFGIATYESDIDTLLKHADTAMYQAKKSGRNRVICNQSSDQ